MNRTMFTDPAFIIMTIILLAGFILIFRTLISPIFRIYRKYSHLHDEERPDLRQLHEMRESIKKSSDLIPPFIFTAFFIIGSFTSYFLVFKPLDLRQKSQTWPSVVCNILSSSVRVSEGEDSTMYGIDIRYSYKFQGREYTSKKYNFWDMRSSFGYKRKQAIVQKYPPGSESVCHVNPEKPEQVVLNREIDPDMKFLGIVPFIFILVGLAGLIFQIRKIQQNKADISSQ